MKSATSESNIGADQAVENTQNDFVYSIPNSPTFFIFEEVI